MQTTRVKDDGSITIDYEYSIEFCIINGIYIMHACVIALFHCNILKLIKLSKGLFVYLGCLFIKIITHYVQRVYSLSNFLVYNDWLLIDTIR